MKRIKMTLLFTLFTSITTSSDHDNNEGTNDYYVILNVSPDVEDREIRKAYLDLARLNHPDKNPHEDTNPKMQRINDAYSVLSDPDKRRKYDRSGNATTEPTLIASIYEYFVATGLTELFDFCRK